MTDLSHPNNLLDDMIIQLANRLDLHGQKREVLQQGIRDILVSLQNQPAVAAFQPNQSTPHVCDTCGQAANWVRNTQFAGKHYFCDLHARQEEDFGQSDESYFFWEPYP